MNIDEEFKQIKNLGKKFLKSRKNSHTEITTSLVEKSKRDPL